MRVLIACECSGIVRDAFRSRGHDAWSCDILLCENDNQYHLQCDVLTVLHNRWDLMIAHPPCTYLTGAAEWAYGDGPYHQRVKPDTLTGGARREARDEALKFVADLWAAPIPRIAIENPVGVINSRLPFMPRPQWIQPHQFGEDASKKTGLWLKNLPPLAGTADYPPRIVDGRPRWGNQTDSGQNRLGPSTTRAADRAKTYKGIADAMAAQWTAK